LVGQTSMKQESAVALVMPPFRATE
jgi:hypothetical protein